MLKDSQLEKKYWVEALMTSIYTRNRVVNKANPNKSSARSTSNESVWM
jgi:hypothetical protein